MPAQRTPPAAALARARRARRTARRQLQRRRRSTVGGFALLPEGFVTFVAKRDGTAFGTATAAVHPATLSYVFLHQGH
jgi:hypothetical protein